MSDQNKVMRIGNTLTMILEGEKFTRVGTTKEDLTQMREWFGDGSNITPGNMAKIMRFMMPETTKVETEIKKASIKENIKATKQLKEEKVVREQSASIFAFAKEDTRFKIEGDSLFLKGFDNVPIPHELAKKMGMVATSQEEIDSWINFWKWCLLNPNPKARDDFYKFVDKYDMPITKHGFAVGYKKVYKVETKDEKQQMKTDLISYVSEAAIKVKKAKKGLQRFWIFLMGGEIRHAETVPEGAEQIGNLKELSEDKRSKSVQQFTDSHSRTMDIRLGVPVLMEKKKCDTNPNNDCSYGLHVGAPSYVAGFRGDTVLAVLFNPMDVVAVPYSDATKLRCSRYIPYAVMDRTPQYRAHFEQLDMVSFDEAFSAKEAERLDEMLDNAKREDLIQRGEVVSTLNIKTIKEVQTSIIQVQPIKEEATKVANKTVKDRVKKVTKEAAETAMEIGEDIQPVEEVKKEPTYTIIIKAFTGGNKLAFVKALKEIFGLGLKEAKEMADMLPTEIKGGSLDQYSKLETAKKEHFGTSLIIGKRKEK